MAEIRIEEKSRPTWIWWVLALLVALLVIWFLFAGTGEVDEVAEAPAAAVAGTEAAGGAVDGTLPAPLQEFVSSCNTAQSGMALDHQYTSACLDRLTASIQAFAAEPGAGATVSDQVAALEQSATRLRESAETSGQHAALVRAAFMSAASAIDAMQNAGYPGLDQASSELTAAAENVGGEQPLLEQREAVDRFFRQAGGVLRAMANATG